jgi:hypothetical protein
MIVLDLIQTTDLHISHSIHHKADYPAEYPQAILLLQHIHQNSYSSPTQNLVGRSKAIRHNSHAANSGERS